MNDTNTATNAESDTESQFSLLRIYLKDASFEVPNAPKIFTEEWKPETNLELNTVITQINKDIYEVVLNITVTTKQDEKTGFLAEVQQAGIFSITGFAEERMAYMLGAYCPNTLFPFAREAISNLVTKGGFPQLLLAPINFDALYQQNIDQIKAQIENSKAP